MPLRCTLWCSRELALIDELHLTNGTQKTISDTIALGADIRE